MNSTCPRKPYISLHSKPGNSTFNPDPAIERLYLKVVSEITMGMFDSATAPISGLLCFILDG